MTTDVREEPAPYWDTTETTDTASRIYTVKFDPADHIPAWQMPRLALDAAGPLAAVPPWNDPHPAFDQMFVTHKRADYLAPGYYKVTVEYVGIIDPLEAEWEIEFDFASSNEPIERDINGNPILNSADEVPDPKPQKEIDDLIYRVTRNEPIFDPLIARQYKGSINDDEFLGFPAKTCRINQYKGKRMKSGPYYYWTVTYEVQIRAYMLVDGKLETWKLRLLDQGFREKVGENDNDNKPKYELIKDKDGNPLSEPTLLNGLGKKLADGAVPIYREWDLYPQKTFASLRLTNWIT